MKIIVMKCTLDLLPDEDFNMLLQRGELKESITGIVYLLIEN